MSFSTAIEVLFFVDSALDVVFPGGNLAFAVDEFFEVAAFAPLELDHALGGAAVSKG